jgi:hypothetical protein
MPKKNLPQNDPLRNGLTPDFLHRPTGLPQDFLGDPMLLTLLGDACRIAADVWRGQEDIALSERIASTPQHEALRIILQYDEMSAVLSTDFELNEIHLSEAIFEAVCVINALLKNGPLRTSFEKLRETRATLTAWAVKTHTKLAFISAQRSIDEILQSDRVAVEELLEDALQLITKSAREQHYDDLANQYAALVEILNSDDSGEKSNLINFFISPRPAGSLDESTQNWMDSINTAITALTELRALLLSQHLTAARNLFVFEEIEHAGLLDWLTGIGDIDILFDSLASAEK